MCWLSERPSTAPRNFIVTAQSITGTSRIQKTIRATSDHEAMRFFHQQSEAVDFYPTDIREAV